MTGKIGHVADQNYDLWNKQFLVHEYLEESLYCVYILNIHH